ncbi:HlyD family type I secretion periplasmic adaptor subunit [Skermanella mucosa]|uniref:HlyD family type I secretion periplasmic adaptor subunit n=1 Tax=Skermanella mucosa TaxID=1789672 RepID=UPI00192AA789|nr:HlyD family type I secretion periplasmic adaptor subunit [Skermanella mucosa]UEM22402.1 HlyD family type I secretion periplasmic adaptor subunit [Skermanella mucosa]
MTETAMSGTATGPCSARVDDGIGRPMIIGLFSILLFFGGLGGWVSMLQIDGAVIAQGLIKVQDNRLTLQHREGGTVKSLEVKEGDRVEADQVLIRLDDTELKANVEILTRQYNTLSALEGRLIAERDDFAEIRFDPILTAKRATDPVIDALLRGQESLHRSRREAFLNEISILRQRIAQLGEQIRGHEGQARSRNDQLRLIREELAGTQELYSKGLAPKTKVRALERAAASLEGERSEHSSNIARVQEAITEAELQIVQLKRDRMAEVFNLMRDNSDTLFVLEPRLMAAQAALARAALKAPTAGDVVGLRIFTEGGVIRPGEPILDIVPERRELVVEAHIDPRDIDDIRLDQQVQVRLVGFRQRNIPAIRGTIRQVSADRLIEERSGTPYYTVIVEVNELDTASTPEIRLVTGMPVELVVPLKARTALDYLLEPLYESFHHAFRE